ncbi:hypothetical protein [Novosphingobium cyanobacteriorum]|uniref:Tetratricopeptide repeat protein n=1 Tax=Novosphingobium cyanobacteriorum TaxID=3024215 RepID=A0ABT6CDS8_9SPHN|nr:hypothetical protein [Novosphingobium cyanobacteriorum]MDF8332083.1 hypothetical protein [Novosphingobium cyanobacteriorum]
MSKISITPVGTCRINTPLRRGATRYPVQLDLARIYGFIHTSREAVQQLQFRAGELEFPADVAPILLRPGYDPATEPPQGNADITIVEISTHKSYTIDGIAVQSNYLSRHFSDFLASPQRARAFWNLAMRGDRMEIEAYLNQPNIARFVSAADRSLLERMSYRLQTADEVTADMATITDMLGKDKVLFVTHINARTADGDLIASRDKVIRWVKKAAQHIGVECFDPTDLMLEFGQERALEREGADLMHGTNPFYDRWYSHVQRTYLLPQFDLDAGADAGGQSLHSAHLTETISAAMEFDDFFGGTRQLFSALRAYPDYVPLKLLHGRVLEQIGDYDGARAVLGPLSDSEEMTAEVRQSLMRALLETGDNAGALALARQMLADEYENEHIYEAAGRAAEGLGELDEAIRYRKLAFRLDPTNHAAGLAVLNAYRTRANLENFQPWLEELITLTEAAGNAASAKALAEWALGQRERDVLGRALLVLARKDMAYLPSLIEDIVASGMEEAMVSTAAAIGALPNLTDKTSKTLGQLAVVWAEKAVAHLAEERFLDAHTFSSACLSMQPRNTTAIKVQRAVVNELRTQVRAARGDGAKILALVEDAGELVLQHKSLAMPFAAALVDQQRLAEAEDVYLRLLRNAPDDHEIATSYAQTASLNGNYHIALETFGRLSELTEDPGLWVTKRVQRFMDIARTRGLRQVKLLTGEERFAEAIKVARLLQRYAGAGERAEEELGRVRKTLRAYLRRLEDDGLTPETALRVLEMMLSIEPNDASALRRAALEAMKVQDYAKALDFWERLDVLMPDNATVQQSIKRCHIYLHRQGKGARNAAVLAA